MINSYVSTIKKVQHVQGGVSVFICYGIPFIKTYRRTLCMTQNLIHVNGY